MLNLASKLSCSLLLLPLLGFQVNLHGRSLNVLSNVNDFFESRHTK